MARFFLLVVIFLMTIFFSYQSEVDQASSTLSAMESEKPKIGNMNMEIISVLNEERKLSEVDDVLKLKFFESDDSRRNSGRRNEKVKLLQTPTLSPTRSFAPTRFFPTFAPVPTRAPVPTGRPSSNPTAFPTSFPFTGTGSTRYIVINTVLNAILTKQTSYNTYNLPTVTTELLASSLLQYFNLPEISLHYSSTSRVSQSELSWTLDVYYNMYVPLNAGYSSYSARPINFFTSLKSNFSRYSSNSQQCCLPDLVATYYLRAGTNYNSSIARTFLFQTIDFYSPYGILVDPTSPPTPSPTLAPIATASPTDSPTAAPVAPAAKAGINILVLIVVIVVVVGILIGSFVYYLYATKQYCFKGLEKDDDDDDDEDEDGIDRDENGEEVVADAKFVDSEEVKDGGVRIPVRVSDARRRSSYNNRPAGPVDDWTSAMNNVGSWLGVPPSDKPVLNIVDLNGAFDNWISGRPVDGVEPRGSHRRSSPGLNGGYPRNSRPSVGNIQYRNSGRSSGTEVENVVQPTWNIENISSWIPALPLLDASTSISPQSSPGHGRVSRGSGGRGHGELEMSGRLSNGPGRSPQTSGRGYPGPGRNPQASGRGPNPQASGRGPNPQASGRGPNPQASGRGPNPQASGRGPISQNRGAPGRVYPGRAQPGHRNDSSRSLIEKKDETPDWTADMTNWLAASTKIHL